MCELCNTLENTWNNEDYAIYKNILPLGLRFFNALTKKKACVYDNELILFRLGNKFYIFNKLNYKEKGLIFNVESKETSNQTFAQVSEKLDAFQK